MIDPELGPMRYCRTCLEDWPDDAEFWAYYVIPAGERTGTGYLRKSPVSITRCRACGTNWIKPKPLIHPVQVVGRVVVTPDGAFLEPLE